MVESALTLSILTKFSTLQLAQIITGPYCAEDKLKAANALPLKLKAFMRSAEWLALSIEDKDTIREAMKFDTTAEGFSAIN
jgi:hypothetical protein